MTALPSGTITFLFTDIEGSTRLFQQHPDAMKGALVGGATRNTATRHVPRLAARAILSRTWARSTIACWPNNC
jgi:hypothetical protein